jgi:hypothetical protein
VCDANIANGKGGVNIFFELFLNVFFEDEDENGDEEDFRRKMAVLQGFLGGN